jgi:hypothetical protein
VVAVLAATVTKKRIDDADYKKYIVVQLRESVTTETSRRLDRHGNQVQQKKERGKLRVNSSIENKSSL